MVTEAPEPHFAPKEVFPFVAAPVPPTPGKPKTTSLDEVVKRHQHVRSVLQHPSLAPVPLGERIDRTAAAKSIVVVDDDADQVHLTVMVLEAAGHAAHGTTRSEAAVELVVEHIADLVLFDYMMPNMSGGALGKAVRANPSLQHTKIVMMSGTPEGTVRSVFDQFDVFLQKPVHPHRLLRTVEDLWG